MIDLAHEGHQGIVKTKYRLRSKVWWPCMDKEVERKCRICHGCQAVSDYPPPEPMQKVVPPNGPWQDCGADLLGPLPSGEYLLVVVDYYSRYFEVVVMKSITSAKVIEVFLPIFARLGMPFSLRTDNGTQFVSEEFQAFLTENGIQHRKVTPLWPQVNGEAERQNRKILKALQMARVEGKDWHRELLKFLTAYRSTPHAATGTTPFALMFGGEMRSKLPQLRPEYGVQDEGVRGRDWSSNVEGKRYADQRRHAVVDTLEIGDKVLVRQPKVNKMSTRFFPEPQEVIAIERGEVTVRNKEGKEMKRNMSFVKQYYETGLTDDDRNKVDNTGVDLECPTEYQVPTVVPKSPVNHRDKGTKTFWGFCNGRKCSSLL